MEPFGVAADADGSVEEFAEAGFGEEIGARAVADDSAIAHENDAIDFGQDVAEVMGDHDEASAFSGEAAEGFAEIALSGEIERVGRLVEEKLAWAMDERARNHDAAFLSGGHGADELRGEVRSFDALESFASAGAHFIRDMKVGPES